LRPPQRHELDRPRRQIVTPGGVPVKGYGGHSIEPHASLAEASDSNVVLIPPIFNDIEQTLADETGLVAWLASFPRGSTLLASSGTGAFLLAEAGLLTGRRVTTNPAFSDLFARRYPSIQLALDERIIGDNMVICAGATTAYLKLAVHIIERLAGRPRPRGCDGEGALDRPQPQIAAPLFPVHCAEGSRQRQGPAAANLDRDSSWQTDPHSGHGE
jgi:transcriptional regulator GlxA family with amidase domain